MPDYLLILLYRPRWQQWAAFLAFMMAAGIIATILTLSSPWLALKKTQQIVQQQGARLTQLRKKVATFPPLQTLQVTTLADKHRQEVTTSVQALWSAGKSVKVTRWQMTTSPGELELQLQWEDLISVFTHLATLAQPCVPDEFTLNRGQDVLILRLRLCADD